MSLKKELQEALEALESTKAQNSDIKEITKIGKANRMIRTRYKTKGWCFDGDHPIIDLDGGE